MSAAGGSTAKAVRRRRSECNQRAAALDPHDQAGWWNLGIAATALGDWREARRAWRGCGTTCRQARGRWTTAASELRRIPGTAPRADPYKSGAVMPGPRLVAPRRELEASYRTYVAELEANGDKLIPFPLTLAHHDFAALLALLAANARGERLPDGFVPNSTFWLVAGGDIVAVSNLRHRLVPSLERRGGHIGYSVRPRCRRRGYGSLILRLTLREAGKVGVAQALVTCGKDNVASARVIRANGGVLQSEEFVAEEGEVVQRYRVAVPKTE